MIKKLRTKIYDAAWEFALDFLSDDSKKEKDEIQSLKNEVNELKYKYSDLQNQIEQIKKANQWTYMSTLKNQRMKNN